MTRNSSRDRLPSSPPYELYLGVKRCCRLSHCAKPFRQTANKSRPTSSGHSTSTGARPTVGSSATTRRIVDDADLRNTTERHDLDLKVNDCSDGRAGVHECHSRGSKITSRQLTLVVVAELCRSRGSQLPLPRNLLAMCASETGSRAALGRQIRMSLARVAGCDG